MTDSTTSLGFIHRWVKPHDVPDGATLLLLHGTGGDENDLLSLGPMLHERAALLSPRGKVLENGMPRFFRRLAEGVFDVPDLIARTHELADFVAAAAKEYGFDPARVIAAGFSNGANIAAAMLLLRPGVLRAAVLLSPMVPLAPEPLSDLAHTPVFIGAGRRDPVATAAGTEQLADLLKRAGAEVSVKWHEGGHNVMPEEVAAAREWLRPLVG
jgi:phospholipase/carboxylesterase